ncbi:AzlD domain-containing protein [Propionibacteriaceae bacterium Y2011]|uniref:AzlD domain-containing protein n=1 Tax=Microlunatus sp. Y2014 TaxID=3418488 RepID=UPI003B44BE45
MTALWIAVVVASLASYAIKLAGLSLPEAWLNHPTVQRIARYLPLALLSALVAVELFDGGGGWTIDWRVCVGVAVAVVLLLLKRGFLFVFLAAITVTAGLQFVPW